MRERVDKIVGFGSESVWVSTLDVYKRQDVLFGSGKVAMISQGSWMVSAFKDNDYIKEHCDVARLPKDAETGESVSLYNGLGWAASANTDMPDEAFQLIEWFGDRKSTRLNSSHSDRYRMPSSA